MRAARRWRALASVAVAAALSGCAMLPPPGAPTASSSLEPTGSADPTASSAAPAPPSSAAPTSSAAPSAAASGGTAVLDAHGCSTAFIDLIVAANLLHYREGFLHPELLDGFDVPCSGTLPAEEWRDFSVYSFAAVRAEPAVAEQLPGRFLDMGLEPDPMAPDVWQTPEGTPVAFMQSGEAWQRINETAIDEPASWIIVIWYEPE
jgi:hypothetical protein